jgi:hypothetical protein
MAFADGSTTRIAIVPEVTWGTTPATPTFQVMRAVSLDMDPGKQTTVSEEIRADGNVPDEVVVGIDPSGTLEGELSYGTFDTLFASALCGAWASDVLKNGRTHSHVTLEETSELGATDAFDRYTGVAASSLGLTIGARSKIGVRFGLMGKQVVTAAAAISGATYTAANTKAILTASSGVGALTIGALTLTIMRLTVNVANGLYVRPVVGSPYSLQHGLGTVEVTGEVEVYVENNDAFDAVLNHETAAISTTIGTVTAEKYTISIPTARLLNGKKNAVRRNEPRRLTIPFRGIYNASDAASIKITRAVA